MRYTIYIYSRVHPNLVSDTSVVEGTYDDAMDKLNSIKKGNLFYEVDDQNGNLLYKTF